MATEVASLFGTLRLDDRQFTSGLRAAESGLNRVAGQMTSIGAGMTAAVTAPIVGAGAAAVKFGLDFDSAMTNAGAVLGQTQEEMEGTRQQILEMGAASRAGPQAVAEAYYDVVGGVQDASTHFDLLTASIATAEAGNADLAATTSGMISVMNAYGFAADDASRVSDNLTQAVGMGVGTMDQFVNALGPASGLAYDVGVSFEELSAATAFLTSTGSSASEATTQLTGVMSAFLKPNRAMTEALQDMGYENGQAALEALGLQGAVSELYSTLGTTDAVAQALGTQEALGGALGLNNDRFGEFYETYNSGLEGATAQARELQNEAERASFDRFMSQLQATGIVIGDVLLPPLTAFLDKLTPLIARVGEADPRLVQMGVAIAGIAAVVGPVLVGLGSLVGAVGSLVGAAATIGPMMAGAGAAIAAVAGPITLVVGAVTALAVAWDRDFMGIQTRTMAAVNPIMTLLQALVSQAIAPIMPAVQYFFAALGQGVAPLDAFYIALEEVRNMITANEIAMTGVIANAWEVAIVVLQNLTTFVGNTIEAFRLLTDGEIAAAIAKFGEFNPLVESAKDILQIFGVDGLDFVRTKFDGVEAAVRGVIDRIREVLGRIEEFQQKIANIRVPDWFGGGGGGGFAGFAMGGNPPVGVPSVVGERGPEMIVPRQPVTVLNNQQSNAMGGGMNVTLNYNGSGGRGDAEEMVNVLFEQLQRRGYR